MNQTAPTVKVKPVPAWAIHRRLYDWVLSFAHHKHSTTALFILSFMESSFFPIPPDMLLIPLCIGHRKKSLMFATVCTVGSVMGAFLGYYIGFAMIDLAIAIIPSVTNHGVQKMHGEFQRHGSWYVFIAALTPFPFKVLTITAGFAKMGLFIFFLACLVGRAGRFFGVALLVKKYGPKAAPFIDRYFNLLCIIFTLLLISVYAFLKWMNWI